MSDLIIEDPTVIAESNNALFLYLILCLSEMLDSLSCSFTSTPFLTNGLVAMSVTFISNIGKQYPILLYFVLVTHKKALIQDS